eukprot:g4154.t1
MEVDEDASMRRRSKRVKRQPATDYSRATKSSAMMRKDSDEFRQLMYNCSYKIDKIKRVRSPPSPAADGRPRLFRSFSLKVEDEWDVIGFEEPLIFPDAACLDLHMPADGPTADMAVELLGGERHVRVIDVLSQNEFSMTLGEWLEYWNTSGETRKEHGIFNMLSLEISGTQLGEAIRAPRAVEEIDWIDLVWPEHIKRTHVSRCL